MTYIIKTIEMDSMVQTAHMTKVEVLIKKIRTFRWGQFRANSSQGKYNTGNRRIFKERDMSCDQGRIRNSGDRVRSQRKRGKMNLE